MASSMAYVAPTRLSASIGCPHCIRQGRSSDRQSIASTSTGFFTGCSSWNSAPDSKLGGPGQQSGAFAARAEAGNNVSRRQALQTAVLASIGALVPALSDPQPSTATSGDPRQQLLDAIDAKKGVQEAIDRIAEINPTPKPNKSDKVDGRWKLLWSSDVAEVSKVTRFLPIGAESFQLIGPGGGIGKGRAQNIVSIGGGAVQLKLTSSCVPDEKNDKDFVVGPPFKLELFLGSKGLPISEVKDTSSERTPILGNELNYFEQVYLEDSGKPGDLRVSRVLIGDDRVVGSIFVHERL